MDKTITNKIFFEDLYQTQMNQINISELKEARKVILGLLRHVTDQNRHNDSQSENAIFKASEWLKNNQS